MIDVCSPIERLYNLKIKNEIFRLGKLFNTNINRYYYDVGTGKVLNLDDGTYKILQYLFDKNDHRTLIDFNNSLDKFLKEEILEFENVIEKENLFLAPKLKKLETSFHNERLEELVDKDLHQIILELTGTCNLRCSYCLYNEQSDLSRNFNNRMMSKEVAKAAIDYINKHSNNKKIGITFYGGEPLIQFDLLKWCIEYAQKTIKNKEVTFSLTTNLTLVTKEIAEYLATVDNLSILGSLDGPEQVHNQYRKYINGKGSFDDSIRGFRHLVEAFDKNSKNTLGINAVFAPPYTYEKIELINNFFNSEEYFTKDKKIRLEYVGGDAINDIDHIKELMKNTDYLDNNGNFIDSLSYWGENQFKIFNGESEKFDNICMYTLSRKLYSIHSRAISRKPMERYPFNGCCVPCSRKIYIDTQGKFYICEKIGNSPSVGDVYSGVNMEKLKKYYINDYSEKSTEDCSKCWAIRFCKHCYAPIYNEEGLDINSKKMLCDSMRFQVEKEFILYHSILEKKPEKLRFLNDIVEE